MSEQHTAGPWVVLHRNDGSLEIRPASPKRGHSIGFQPIAEVQQDRRLPNERIANAALLAASPELLAALEEAREGLLWYRDRNPGQSDGSDEEAMERIDAAIAKARGAA